MIKQLAWMGLWLAAPALAADVSATLQWSQRVELGAAVSGTVRTVHVQPGERVRKGQSLVSLDADAYRAAVAEAASALAQAQEEEKDAKRNLDRVQELYDRTVIAATELEAAQLRHARARAQLEAARARLAVARKRLDDAVVRAPFDAIVLARTAEPGQAVSSQLKPEPLVAVARAGEMLARGMTSLAEIRKLEAGQAVIVEVEGRRYAGRIRTLGLEPVGSRGEYVVEAVFPVDGVLRAGTPALIRLP